MSFMRGSLGGPLPFPPGRPPSPAWGWGVEEKGRVVCMLVVGLGRVFRERERKVEMRGVRRRVRVVCEDAILEVGIGGW
jgi:hypothetical protein